MPWINSKGYRELRLPDGRKIKEHRLVMEQSLCRRLSPQEIVHHRNGERLDNRLENLQIMTRTEHCKEHGSDQLAPHRHKGTAALIKHNTGKPAWNFGTTKYIFLVCPKCGITFEQKLKDYERNERRNHRSYCSKHCSCGDKHKKARGQ